MNCFKALIGTVLFVCAFGVPNPSFAQDLSLLKQAIEGNLPYEALEPKLPNDDPVLRDLVFWNAISQDSDLAQKRFQDVQDLIKRRPDWPGLTLIKRRLETALPFWMSDRAVIIFFSNRSPSTITGMRRYVAALDRSGEKTKATDALRRWWREALIPPADQDAALKYFGQRLGQEEDHWIRLQSLLAPSVRHYTNARQLATSVPNKGWVAYVEARIALQNPKQDLKPNRHINALRRLNRDLLTDPHFLRDRAGWHKDQDDAQGNARFLEIIKSSRTSNAKQVYIPAPRDWWRDQRIVINRFIRDKDYKSAYKLATVNPFQGGFEAADINFVAGWLALRKLNDPQAALPHFHALYKGVSTATSISRAGYWLGRAYEALGDKSQAGVWYGTAAQFPYHFYGQLAAEKEFCRKAVVPSHKIPVSLDQQTSRTQQLLGHSMSIAYDYLMAVIAEDEAWKFLNELANYAQYKDSFSALAQKALDKGAVHHSLSVARKGYNRYHHKLGKLAFPTLDDQALESLTYHALVHAVIRQESGFDPEAVSHANARGLMQLLPSTARKEAEELGLEFNPDWLTQRPDYNIQLGEAHLKRLLVDDGQARDMHVMVVLAGYNAGMRRVREWIELYGNPKDLDIDPIDWMESLPFSETRDYVRKVLENFVVYQRIFAHPDRTLIEVDSCTQ